IRVPLIYHLGGLVSIVNDDLVGSVDYLPGGYGVEYGRSTGGVININTSQKYPEKFRVETSVDLLDSGAVIQGRTGKNDRWGLTAAGRRSYIDVFIPIFTQDTGFTVKPYWWDYQAKIDDLEKENGRFSILLMGFGDKLFFGSPDDVAQGTDQDEQGDADVRYGSHRVIAQYTQEFSPELTARFTPSLGLDFIAFGLGNSFKFEQKSWLTEIRGDLLWNPVPALTLRPGVDIIGGPYEVEIELPYSPESLANTDPLAEREDFATLFEGSVWAIDPFIEAWIKPIEGSDTLIVTPGIRFNTLFFPNYSKTSFDPRLSLRYSPFEQTTVKAGSGIYHQPPQGPDLGFNSDDIQVDFERNWGSEFGIEQSFGAAIEAEVTTFYKKLDELIIENENLQSDDDPFFINGGEGRVMGMEMMLRHNPVGNFFGWISYTLSKAERYQVPTQGDDASGETREEEWRPFEYDQTHILVALAGFELPKDWGISGRYRYTTGNPYTPYDGGIYDVDQDAYTPYATGTPLSDRLPPFTSLDLRVDKVYTFKRWWLETYVDLLNVVRGENPETVQYNYDYTEEAYVRGLPFLPSVGFRAEFEL
ncbi:MAG: TonB-dependent receptor plug domain-containing protein, partial [Myxococcota bacterium]